MKAIIVYEDTWEMEWKATLTILELGQLRERISKSSDDPIGALHRALNYELVNLKQRLERKYP